MTRLHPRADDNLVARYGKDNPEPTPNTLVFPDWTELRSAYESFVVIASDITGEDYDTPGMREYIRSVLVHEDQHATVAKDIGSPGVAWTLSFAKTYASGRLELARQPAISSRTFRTTVLGAAAVMGAPEALSPADEQDLNDLGHRGLRLACRILLHNEAFPDHQYPVPLSTQHLDPAVLAQALDNHRATDPLTPSQRQQFLATLR